ncbi:MAG: transposase family protein [Dehalococcoidia bacterium]|nr:transposase family protein [Dehalococcoidia bacterium]
MWHVDLMYLRVNGRSYFLVTVIGSCYRCIVCWELALPMRAQEIAETIAVALEEAPAKSPRIVRDNGSQFVAKEWREFMRHFALK